MENYRRYDTLSESKYNRKGLSYLLMRKKADRVIIPYLENIVDKSVLEVGVGYGYYRDIYFSLNRVTGYDVNPELGEKLSIEIIAGKADEIRKVNRRFDRVLSFFMTEYLNSQELQRFIDDSVDVLLNPGGIFLTTIIIQKGLGDLYTKLASIKGIKKYSYTYEEIRGMVGEREYRMIPLNTYWGIPWAVLLEIKK